ncbi:MAG: hypothetical protein IAG10_09830 [Planctomycetaceae bacterium]|nr:hypothetical protein [Planctomycetaceae bacterium]
MLKELAIDLPRPRNWDTLMEDGRFKALSAEVLQLRDRVMACSNKSFLDAVAELPVVGSTIAAISRRFLRRR